MTQVSRGTEATNENQSRADLEVAPQRLLVIEGDGFTRLLMLRWFRTVGFHVDFTSNGQIGFRKLLAHTPDAIVMDTKLRGLSGVELLEKARLTDFGSRPIYLFCSPKDLTRSERKILRSAKVRVLDRRMMTVERLAAEVLAELNPQPDVAAKAVATVQPEPSQDMPAQEQQPAELKPASSEPQPATAGETMVQALAAVYVQAEMVLSCTEQRTRLASCGVLRGKVQSLVRSSELAGKLEAARMAATVEHFVAQLYLQPELLDGDALELLTDSVETLKFVGMNSFGQEEECERFKVVLVEEDALLRKTQPLAAALQDWGFAVECFNDPSRVRHRLESASADLVINFSPVPELHGLDSDSIHCLPQQKQTAILEIAPIENSENPKGDQATSTTPEEINKAINMKFVLKALNLLHKPSREAAGATAKPKAATPESVAGETSAQPLTHDPVPGPSPAAFGTEIPAGGENQPEHSQPEPEAAPRFDVNAVFASKRSAEPAPLKPIDATRQTTVLFVEDDPFILKLYRRWLKGHGYKVESAEDGAAALQILPTLVPDVVVLDLMLPRVSGLEVLKFMRADPALNQVPVLVFSNAFMDSLASKALQAGATQGVLKNQCTPARLLEILSNLLGKTLPARADAGSSSPIEGLPGQESSETSIWLRQNDPVLKAPGDVIKIREACLGFIKSVGEQAGSEHLERLYRGVRFLSARSGLSGLTKVAEVASALEALLFDLVFHSSVATPSTMQTIAQGVDCLARLIQSGDTKFPQPRPKPAVLVVDDDSVCTFTSVAALNRAGFEAIGVQEPNEALRILERRDFDLIILDINMPEMNGFEVCERLRDMPQHQFCPVMFVTLCSEFQNRARSVLAGGNDLLPKPVSAMELVLKSTLHVVNTQARPPGHRTAPASTQQSSLSSVAIWKAEQLPSDAGEEAPAAGVDMADPRTVPLPEIADPTTGIEVLTNEAAVMAEPGSEVVFDEPVETREAVTINWIPDISAADGVQERVNVDVESSLRADQNSGLEMIQPPSPPRDELVALREQLANQQAELAKYTEDRDDLANRIFKAENDLYRQQVTVQNRDHLIEKLRQELDEWKLNSTSQPQASASVQTLAKETDELLKQAEVELAEANSALDAKEKERAELETRLQQFEATTNAHREEQSRFAALQTKLAELEKAHEAVQASLAAEQQTSAITANRANSLEQKLSQTTAELQRAQANLEVHTKDRTQLENTLQQQLAAATKAHQEEQSRCASVQSKVADLDKAHQEVRANLAAEQKAAGDATNRAKDLEQKLDQATGELQKAQQALAIHTKEQSQLENNLQQQLAAATKAHKEEQSRCASVQSKVADLDKAHQEVRANLAAEQKAAGDATNRAKDLEQKLDQATGELQKAQQALAIHTKEQSQLENNLQQQLAAATKAHKEDQSRSAALQTKFVDLEKAHQQLQASLTNEQKAAATAANRATNLEQKLSQASADLQTANQAVEVHAKDHSQRENKLQQQLDAATKAQKEEQSRSVALQTRLTDLENTHQQMRGEIGNEQKATASAANRAKELEQKLSQTTAELHRAHDTLQTHTNERTQFENTLKQQLEASTNAHKEAQSRCAALQSKVAGLEKAQQAVQVDLANERKAALTAADHAKDLEQKLSQATAELHKANQAFEIRTKDHSQLEHALKQQFEASTKAHKEEQSRCAALQTRLAELEKAHQTVQAKLANEKKAAATAVKRAKDSEQKLSQATAELQQAHDALQQHSKEHTQSESSLMQQLEVATKAHQEEQSRCGSLQTRVADLERAQQQLQADFDTEQKTATLAANRAKDLEQNLSQTTVKLKNTEEAFKIQAKDRTQFENTMKQQLEASSKAYKEAQSGCAALQESVSNLESQISGIKEAQATAAAALVEQKKELEGQLAQKSSEALQAKNRCELLERNNAATESTLRRQLARTEHDLQQQQARSGELEGQFASLKKEHQAAQTRLADQQHLQEELTAMAKLTSDLAQEKGVRQRAEARGQQLSERLLQIQQAHTTLLQSEHETQSQLAELQHSLTQAREASERAQLELSHVRLEREQLNHQLGNARELNLQYREHLSVLQAASQQLQNGQGTLQARLEQLTQDLDGTRTQLKGEAVERGRLAAALEISTRRAESNLLRVRQLEIESKETAASLVAAERKVEAFAAEREQLRQVCETAERAAREQDQKTAVETARVASSLQVERLERQRIEGQMLRLRQATVEGSRACRDERARLRQKLQAPTLRLFDNSRQLLSLELSEPQKQLADKLLHDAMLLHAGLQEPVRKPDPAVNAALP